MKIKLNEITVRELAEGYEDNTEGGVVVFGGKLDIRPPYQGDTLVLGEYDPKTKQYTGKKIEKQVKYVLKFALSDFGQKKEIEEKGLYVIQL